MPFLDLLLVAGVLLVAILICSWFYSVLSPPRQKRLPLSKEYLTGLNFLLNEQPDKAVDVFIRMLEVDNDTVETHLALGKLFRKRGEVDRAIKIHQNLVARPSLELSVKVQALLALGQDYLSAGVLDRSEQAFKEVLTLDSKNKEALASLLDIYQQEREWGLAIEVAQSLSVISQQNTQKVIAQCYCEIAERRLAQSEVEACVFALKKALGVNRHCVRANLMLASVHTLHFEYKQAIKSLKRIVDHHPEYLSEIISPLALCFERLSDEHSLGLYLEECLKEYPQITIHALLMKSLLGTTKVDGMRKRLLAHTAEYPSISGVSAYIKTLISDSNVLQDDVLSEISNQLDTVIQNQSNYQCVSCGFSSKKIHWQCPSCRDWESVKPIIPEVMN